MSEEIRFYRGIHKVKVVTQSEGYWIVEALEDFSDMVDGKKIAVRSGDERIVSPKLLYKRMILAPPIKEHTYELKMEKKLKRIVEKEQEKNSQNKES